MYCFPQAVKLGPSQGLQEEKKKKPTKQFEDIGMEIASFCY